MDIQDIRVAAGQVLIGGFDGYDLTSEVEAALAGGRLGGIILFRRNVRDLEQLVALNRRIHHTARPLAPWVCVDQEGGPVQRIREEHGATPIPAARVIGEAGNYHLTTRIGELIASEVGALGFNVNFAPVLDVDTHPDNPVIGPRSYSRDPHVVTRMAGQIIVGHLICNVLPCGKHFPGHGDTELDSHHALPTITHDWERLRTVELYPFKHAIRAGLPMIMSAHIRVPALDPSGLPATLSAPILTDLLRKKFRFEGIVVSDDMEMAAIADNYGIEEAVLLGLRAGIDLFLICHRHDRQEAAYRALVQAAESSTEDRDRLFAAATRLTEHRERFFGKDDTRWEPGFWESVVGCDEHRALVAPLFERQGVDS